MARQSAQDRLARIRAKMEEQKSAAGTSTNYWKPAEGNHIIRVLPEVKGMELFWQTVGKHRINGQWYSCPNVTTEGELPCPLCEINEEAWKNGQKEIAKQFYPKRSYYMNIVVRDVANHQTLGPYVYTPGITVFDILTTIFGDPEYGDITDISEGHDLKLTRKGQSIETTYQLFPSGKKTPLAGSQEDIDRILEEAEDLSTIIDRLPTYDSLLEAAGMDGESTSDDAFGNDFEDDFEEDF